MLKLEKPVNKLYQAPNIPRVHTLSPLIDTRQIKVSKILYFPTQLLIFMCLAEVAAVAVVMGCGGG